MFDPFDMDMLEIGDIVYLDVNGVKFNMIILDITDSQDVERYYSITYPPSAAKDDYVESVIKEDIEDYAYRIVKPFAGLELI